MAATSESTDESPEWHLTVYRYSAWRLTAQLCTHFCAMAGNCDLYYTENLEPNLLASAQNEIMQLDIDGLSAQVCCIGVGSLHKSKSA